MCTVISIINNKGGVGKTTSTGILAELLSYLQKRTLVVDLDQQSNLSMLLDCYEEDSEDVINELVPPASQNISDIFKYRYRDKEMVLHTIRKTTLPFLDIIPSSKRHKNTQEKLAINKTGNNNIILKKALATIKDDYDFILIDNAPANDALTVNSLFASDIVYVPVRVEGFSYKGLKETIDTILYIKEEHDLDTIQFGGAFITQAEPNTNIYKDVCAEYVNELGSKFFTTPIRKDIKISEIETNFRPVLEYCPDTNAVFDYAKLLLEFNILDSEAAAHLRSSIQLY